MLFFKYYIFDRIVVSFFFIEIERFRKIDFIVLGRCMRVLEVREL